MLTIPRSSGLTTEQVQGMLDKYLAAVEAFPSTVGVPAPLPENDFITQILQSGEEWVVEELPPEPVPPTFEELKAQYKNAIDGLAGQTRLRYITDVPGQEATYLLKAQQAEAYAVAGFAGTVPAMLAAEAAATNQTPQQVAQSVIATRDVWVNVLNPQIESVRIGGKMKVDAAADAKELAALWVTVTAALAVV